MPSGRPQWQRNVGAYWHDAGMVRRRSIRDVLRLVQGDVLVRALFEVYDHGGDYDRDALIADVTYNFDVFG